MFYSCAYSSIIQGAGVGMESTLGWARIEIILCGHGFNQYTMLQNRDKSACLHADVLTSIIG